MSRSCMFWPYPEIVDLDLPQKIIATENTLAYFVAALAVKKLVFETLTTSDNVIRLLFFFTDDGLK